MFLGAAATVNGVALPFLIDRFSLPLSTAGALFMIHSLGYLLSSTFFPSIARLTGTRLLILAGSTATAAALVGLPLMPCWWAVLAAALVSGAAYSAIDVGLNAVISSLPGERGTAALNWLHFSFGLGALAGPSLLAQVMALSNSWQWAYWACALPFLPLSGALAKNPLLKLESAASDSPDASEERRSSIYGESVFWLLMILMAVYCGVENSLMGWIPTYLSAELGQSVGAASLGVSLLWAGLALGRGMAGRFSRSLSPRTTVLALFPATAVVLLAAAGLDSAHIVLAGFFLAGLGLSAIFPMLMLTGTRMYPHARVQVSGGLVTAAGIGSLVFPWILGYVGEYASLRLGILLLAALSFAAGILVTRLPKASAAEAKVPPGKREASQAANRN